LTLKDLCLGYLYQWKDDTEESNKHLSKIIKNNYECSIKTQAEAMLLLAENYNLMKSDNEAIKLVKRILKLDLSPVKKARAYLILLRSCKALNKKRNFIKYSEVLKAIIEENPDGISNHIKFYFFTEQGLFHHLHRRHDKTISCITKALDFFDVVEPSLEYQCFLFGLIGVSYHLNGDYESAISFYKVVLEKTVDDKKRVDFNILLGVCNQFLRKYEDTIYYYLKAFSFAQKAYKDKEVLIAYKLGNAYTLIEDWGKALSYFLRCFPGESNTNVKKIPVQRVNYCIGYCLVKLSRADEAIEYLYGSFHEWPRRVNSWETNANYFIGEIMESRGELHKALKRYLYAKAYAPKISQIKEMPDPEKTANYLSTLYQAIGRTYHKLDKNHKALKYLKKSVHISQKEKENTHNSYDLMTKIYSKLGKDEKAQEAREESLKYSKNSVSVVDENRDLKPCRQ